MTNNTMSIGYIYANLKIKKPPEFFCKTAHIGRLIACIPSRLSWTPSFRGSYWSLLRPILPTLFSGTNNQEGPTKFDTSMWYMLWYSGCTHSINPYFELYTHYKPLEKGDDTEVNGVRGLIKPKGIVTIVLDMEDDTGKIHNNILNKSTTSLEFLISS